MNQIATLKQVDTLLHNRSLTSSFTARRRDHAVKFTAERDYALEIISNNDALARCDPQSVTTALLDLASTGLTLSPRLSLAYLVPYKGRMKLEISYRGMEHMCYRSGGLKQLQANVVLKGDHFVERHTDAGPGFEHIPRLSESTRADEMPPIIAAYCMAHFANGGRHYERIDAFTFQRVIDAAMAKNNGKVPFTYTKWPEEMWKKACVRRAWKHWPKDETMQQAIEMIDRNSTPMDFGPSVEPVTDDGGVLTITSEQAEQLRQRVREAFPDDSPEHSDKRVALWMEGFAEMMHVGEIENLPEVQFEDVCARIDHRIKLIKEKRKS